MLLGTLRQRGVDDLWDRRSSGVLRVLGVLGVCLTLACSSRIGAGGSGDSGGNSPLASWAQPESPRATTTTPLSSPAARPEPPADEAARQLAQYEQVCANQVSLPGSGVTVLGMEVCAAVLDASPCELPDGPPAACTFVGSLPGGSPCGDGIQCQSGICDGTIAITPEGPASPFTCGKCVPVVGVGQSCESAACASGSLCLSQQTSSGPATHSCVGITQGAVDAPCDGLAKQCEPGLYCAAASSRCQALASEGEPCGDGTSPPGDPGGCRAPLGCEQNLSDGPATCVSHDAGGSCLADQDCAPGFGCIPAGPCSNPARFGCSASGMCSAITWVEPGQPCSDQARCLVNSCDFGFTPFTQAPDGGLLFGTCPTVVPDGQPCTISSNCDQFSECFQGTCVPIDGFSCP